MNRKQDLLFREFKDHFIFDGRMQGASKFLKGKIVLLLVFVDDTVSKWNESSINGFAQHNWKAIETLNREAKKYGVDIDIQWANCQVSVPMEITMHNRDEWVKSALASLGVKSASDYQVYLEKAYGCDEVPVIFVVNKQFRSYAHTANEYYPHNDEFSVVSGNEQEYCIIHELLHQFGAADFYYPKEVSDIAHKFLPNSVMNVYNGTNFDAVTRYLIGWTDEIEPEAAAFLRRTANYTYEDIQNAIRDIWKKENK